MSLLFFSNQLINQSRSLCGQHEKKLRSSEHMVFLRNTNGNMSVRGCIYDRWQRNMMIRAVSSEMQSYFKLFFSENSSSSVGNFICIVV